MNILFLTKDLPSDSNLSDKFRPYRFLIHLLQNKHDLTVICAERNPLPNDIIRLEKMGIKVLVKNKKYNKIINYVISFIKLIFNPIIPFRFQLWIYKDYITEIKRITREVRFEVVYIHSIHMAHYEKYVSFPKVIDLVDSKALNLERSLYLKKDILFLFKFFEMLHVKHYEKKIAGSNNIILTSSVDANYIGKIKNLFVVPVVISQSFFSEETKPINKINKSILFVGNYSYKPNLDALNYFLKSIYPIIVKNDSKIKMQIVGKGLDSDFIKKNFGKVNIQYLGFVRDIKLKFLESHVFIAPLRFGTGVKNKIIEAMALGIPVVCTSIGNEGINAVNGKQIIIAKNAKDFAYKLIQIINSETLLKEIGKNGKNFVYKTFHPDIILKKFDYVFECIIKHEYK